MITYERVTEISNFDGRGHVESRFPPPPKRMYLAAQYEPPDLMAGQWTGVIRPLVLKG